MFGTYLSDYQGSLAPIFRVVLLNLRLQGLRYELAPLMLVKLCRIKLCPLFNLRFLRKSLLRLARLYSHLVLFWTRCFLKQLGVFSNLSLDCHYFQTGFFLKFHAQFFTIHFKCLYQFQT